MGGGGGGLGGVGGLVEITIINRPAHHIILHILYKGDQSPFTIMVINKYMYNMTSVYWGSGTILCTVQGDLSRFSVLCVMCMLSVIVTYTVGLITVSYTHLTLPTRRTV